MANKFHERFGIELGVAEGKRRFVNRVLNFLFGRVAQAATRMDAFSGWEELEKYVCSKQGAYACLCPTIPLSSSRQ